MLLYALLAAALLLSATACPCPPAPVASEVCGSDLVTYASLCHLLQCSAVPGLSLEHPGPCSTENAVSADQPTGGRAHHRSRRSSTEEKQELDECEEERQCGNATCSECGAGDADCANMCKRNCRCGCAGYPPGGEMDKNLRTEIEEEMKCLSTRLGCKTWFFCAISQSCVDECELNYRKCLCESVQRAGNRSSVASGITTTTDDTTTTTTDETTTTSPTSSTSRSTSRTTSPEEPLPCVPVVLEYVLVFASACVCVSVSVWVLARACRLVSPPVPARGAAQLAPLRQPGMGSENKLYVYLVQPRMENENKLHI